MKTVAFRIQVGNLSSNMQGFAKSSREYPVKFLAGGVLNRSREAGRSARYNDLGSKLRIRFQLGAASY
jgi:hypothetical protein